MFDTKLSNNMFSKLSVLILSTLNVVLASPYGYGSSGFLNDIAAAANLNVNVQGGAAVIGAKDAAINTAANVAGAAGAVAGTAVNAVGQVAGTAAATLQNQATIATGIAANAGAAIGVNGSTY